VALADKEDSAVSANVKLGLADAYRHLGRQRDAILLLVQLTDASTSDKDLQDDALYLLAYCQQEIQAWNDAKATWKSLIHRFPDSHFTPEARLQLAQLSVFH
jgi:TolA-binding protein